MTACRRFVFGLCLLVGSTFFGDAITHAVPDLSALKPLNIALVPVDPDAPHMVSGHIFSQVEPTEIRKVKFSLTDWNGADVWEGEIAWTEDFSDGTSARVPFEFDLSKHRLAGKHRFKAYLLGERDAPLAVGRRIVNFPWSTAVEGSLSEVSNFSIRNGEQVTASFSFLNRGKEGEFQGEVRVFEDSPNRPQVFFERTESVEVGVNHEQDFSLTFDRPRVPQLYVVEVLVAKSLGDAVTGVLRQSFLVDGAFAEAQDLVIAPQRYYHKGDMVAIEFGGYARNVSDGIIATISVADEKNTELFVSKQELPLLDEYGHIHGRVAFPMETATSRLQGKVVLSYEGKALGETEFETPRFPEWGNGSDSLVGGKIGQATDRIGGIWKTNPKMVMIAAGIVLGAFLIVMLAGVVIRKKRINGKHLILLLASGLLLGQASAATTVEKFLPEGAPTLVLYELALPYEEMYSVSENRRADDFNIMQFQIVGYSMEFDASIFQSGEKPTVAVSFDDGANWISVPPEQVEPLDDLYLLEDWLTFSVELPEGTSEGIITPRVQILSGLAASAPATLEVEWRDIMVDNSAPDVAVSRNPEGWTSGDITVSVECNDRGESGCIAGEDEPVEVTITENHGSVEYFMCDKVSNCASGTVVLDGVDTAAPELDDMSIFDYEEQETTRKISADDVSVTRALTDYLLQITAHDEGSTDAGTEDPCGDVDLYWDGSACQPKEPVCIVGPGMDDLTRGIQDLPTFSDDCEPSEPQYECSYTDFPFCFNLTLPGAPCLNHSECPSTCINGVAKIGQCAGGACAYSASTCPNGCAATQDACCEVDCVGKICGASDGCGGQCVAPCDSRCGDDGFGTVTAYSDGICGSGGCAYTEDACASGVCSGDECCIPACSGKVCGPDGCGAECGPGCSTSETCVSGDCKSDCVADTVNNCEISLNAEHGDQQAGDCIPGFVGGCAYRCNDGNWDEVTDSCTLAACNGAADCDDGNDCTTDVCNNPGEVTAACQTPPKTIDTPCNTAGGSFCNGSGACVVCNADGQCDDGEPLTDNVCSNAGTPSAECAFPAGCFDDCASLGYQCGTPEICGATADCGLAGNACPSVDCSSMDTDCRTYDDIPQDCNAGTYLCEHPSYPGGCGSLVTDVAIGTPATGGYCDGMGDIATCGTNANCDDGNPTTTDTCLKPDPMDSTGWSCSNFVECTNYCTEGETRCFEGDVQSCATDHDADPCTEWADDPACTGGDVCTNDAGTDKCCDPLIGTTVNTNAQCGGTVLCDGSVSGSTDCTATGKVCNAGTCEATCSPVDGGWTDYSWSCANSTTRLGTRTCTNPAPSCGGAACVGSATTTASCAGDYDLCLNGVCGCNQKNSTCSGYTLVVANKGWYSNTNCADSACSYNGDYCHEDSSVTLDCCHMDQGDACTVSATCQVGTVQCDGSCGSLSSTCGGGTPYCDGAGSCDECTSDTHCAGDETCSSGTCVALTCGECETALNHVCVDKSANDPCSIGVCNGSGTCVNPVCDNDGQCSDGNTCTSDVCTNDGLWNAACSNPPLADGTDVGTCIWCDGAGGTYDPNGDTNSCGPISCDDWHHIVGTASATGTNYCYDSPDLTSANNCEGEGDCKDANTADCGSTNDTQELSCGICKYVAGCSGTTDGTCANYPDTTPCGTNMECQGGVCQLTASEVFCEEDCREGWTILPNELCSNVAQVDWRYTAHPAGTPCTGGVCDGSGSCVECTLDSHCPGEVCSGGNCVECGARQDCEIDEDCISNVCVSTAPVVILSDLQTANGHTSFTLSSSDGSTMSFGYYMILDSYNGTECIYTSYALYVDDSPVEIFSASSTDSQSASGTISVGGTSRQIDLYFTDQGCSSYAEFDKGNEGGLYADPSVVNAFPLR